MGSGVQVLQVFSGDGQDYGGTSAREATGEEMGDQMGTRDTKDMEPEPRWDLGKWTHTQGHGTRRQIELRPAPGMVHRVTQGLMPAAISTHGHTQASVQTTCDLVDRS